MVSGPQADIDVVKDALSVFGTVFVIGDKPGMAQTMKLANNFLSATAMAATSEAVAMGVKAGLDPAVMIDVINAGSGRNTAIGPTNFRRRSCRARSTTVLPPR